MSDSEIIKRLAKWMGWTWQRQPKCWVGAKGTVEEFEEWDPLESLDDCRIVEDAMVTRGRFNSYYGRLTEVVFDANAVPKGMRQQEGVFLASPRLRCEALLKIINEIQKWR